MKANRRTEEIFLISSYLFLLGLCDPVQSRPCGIVKDDTCAKCLTLARCYQANDCHWCCDCNAGQYVQKDCDVNYPKTTTCNVCVNQTFTAEHNHQYHCNISTSADTCTGFYNTKFVLGNASQDNRCICKEGFYAENNEFGGCKPHFKCPVGFGVATLGTGTHDTVCEYCENGKCSDTESATEPCKSTCDNITISNGTTAPTPTVPQVLPQSSSITVEGVFLGIGVMITVSIGLFYWFRCNQLKKQKRRKKKREEKKRRSHGSRHQELVEMTDMTPHAETQPLRDETGQKEEEEDSQEDESPKKPLIPKEKRIEEDPETQPPEIVVLPETKLAALPDEHVPEFKIQFRNAGYEVAYEPECDRDCLYRAVAYALLLSKVPNPSDEAVEEKARTLRNGVIEHLHHNSEQYRNRIAQPWDTYINSLNGNNRGDEIIVEVLSQLTSTHVQVIRTDGSTLNEASKSNRTTIIIGMVAAYRDTYYVTLHRIGAPSNESVSSQGGSRVESSDIVSDGPTTSLEQPQSISATADDPIQNTEPLTEPSLPVVSHLSRSQPDEAESSSQNSLHEESDQGAATEPCPSAEPFSEQSLPDASRSSGSFTHEDDIDPHSVSTRPYQSTEQASDSNSQAESQSGGPVQMQGEVSVHEPSDQRLGVDEDTNAEQARGGAVSPQGDPEPTHVKVPMDGRGSSHEQDLALFDNESQRRELVDVDANVLHCALEDSNYLDAMCNYLVDKIRTPDLKEMLQSLMLLNDSRIDDIERERRYDQREMRRFLLKEMQIEKGDNFTPRILLQRTLKYRMRKPYDDLCKGFIEHLKSVLTT